ncbi:MAG: TolC family protein [Bacteroidales bacterium]|nr:TolC family protein [Bacteroidales bacterium]
MDPDRVLTSVFDFSFIDRTDLLDRFTGINSDSAYNLEQIRLSGDLISKQIISEKGRLLPVVGIEAFAGGNQFTDRFDPLDAGRWYGSSYAGISVRIPVAGGDISGNRIRQLRLRDTAIRLNYTDELKKTINKSLILNEEIRQIYRKIGAGAEVLDLYRENLSVYRERFESGLLSASEILDYDMEFMNEKIKYRELNADLLAKKIDAVRNSGNIERLIRELR